LSNLGVLGGTEQSAEDSGPSPYGDNTSFLHCNLLGSVLTLETLFLCFTNPILAVFFVRTSRGHCQSISFTCQQMNHLIQSNKMFLRAQDWFFIVQIVRAL
jgi:hypothetical protein